MITTEQIKNLQERGTKLHQYLQIEKKKVEIANEEERTAAPDFWNDPKKAEVILRELRTKKKWVDDYNKIIQNTEDLEVLLDFAKEDPDSEQELEDSFKSTLELLEEVEFRNMLSDEGDNLSAVLQITAGAGGTESCDWAAMLLRMYQMWCDKKGYKVKTLNYQEGDVAGVKTVSIEIEGEYAFGFLKGENGVHRLVRISPFDSNAKRHTSFASVYVYPLADDSINIEIDPSEITWETFRSSGAGGQGVNKIETAVRLRHKSSGLVVENQESRSQLENKNKAIQLLKSQLYEIELQKKQAKRAEIEADKKKIDFGSQIRNYVMHPYKLVKDVRTSYETGNVDDVMNGGIDGFLKSFLMLQGQQTEETNQL
ncbi:MAG: peptide chain release factor 2 [Flavobacteriaceae bacterium]